MTAEEKAKAYDEAIEKAREYWETDNDNTLDIKAKGTMEYLFPELRESEDERIMEKIIATIHLYYGEPLEDEAKEMIAWLEKQDKCETDCHSNHQDANHPNGCITLENFNDGEGFYKVHLDYLNKKQVEEIEEMIRTWNKDSKVPNENIKSCIGMCLTDVCEQRFRDYNTSLKDCLAWLEKQGTSYTKGDVDDAYVEGMAFAKDELEKQKPSWSEEDERMCQETIDWFEKKCFPYALESENPARESIKWLKSLKQRLK